MNCPYCGYSKLNRVEDKRREFTCRRCDYLFEVSTSDIVLDKIFSVPFCSLIYTPAILTIGYYIARRSYNSYQLNLQPDSWVLSFGFFISFHYVLIAFILLFILLISRNRKKSIFLFEIKEEKAFLTRIMDISPLTKISVMLFVAAFIFFFIYI
jgi:hypothetical protein